MWIRTIILLVLFIILATAAHGADEATATLECAESTNKVFFGPSSARDDWFIDCIMKKSPSSDRADLRHRLDTGEGDELLHRLATGGGSYPFSEVFATTPSVTVPHARTSASGAVEEIDPDCPYLTFKIGTPSQGHDADERRVAREIQKPYMEKFSSHLKRAGFKPWEPLGARLKLAGLKELGAWWARIWPLLSDEGRWPNPGPETAELEKIMAKLAPDDRARAEQIKEDYEKATWNVELAVIDFGESEQIVGAVKGDRIIVWSLIMNKRPTVLDGALRIRWVP